MPCRRPVPLARFEHRSDQRGTAHRPRVQGVIGSLRRGPSLGKVALGQRVDLKPFLADRVRQCTSGKRPIIRLPQRRRWLVVSCPVLPNLVIGRVRTFVRFQDGPSGRSRRRHSMLAFADAPAVAASTPGDWREREVLFGPLPTRESRGRHEFDKGTLAMAPDRANGGRPTNLPDRQVSVRAIAPYQIRRFVLP